MGRSPGPARSRRGMKVWKSVLSASGAVYLSLASEKLRFKRGNFGRQLGSPGAGQRLFCRKSLGPLRVDALLSCLEQERNSLKFFSSSGLICSLSLGRREVITVVYYLVKDP